MNIIEALKGVMPALALMAACSAAILYLPQWNQDADRPSDAARDIQQEAPSTVQQQQERDKQA